MNHRTDLQERLSAYAASGALPMHMPGHKRNMTAAPFLAPLGGGMDITEIQGFDDLHRARGILREEMDRAAALWGARRTFFLVNGSSCGLLAAIYALGLGGGKAIVARNCHKSVYHGLELCALTPVWLRPDWCAPLGLWGSVPPSAVERALDEVPEARFVLLTSPTYDGVLSDTAALADICHARGVPLLVDGAHGAHLGFGGFPDGAVRQGADLVVHSAHKTLPSLTQTAALHISGDLVDAEAVERALNVFESSSPSYLLLSSLSGCVRFLERPGALAPWREGLAAFDREIEGLTGLYVPGHGRDAGALYPGVFGWDPSKILIYESNGYWIMDTLRERFGIELEMARPHCALALTGAGDDTQSLTRLARALQVLDKEREGACPPIPGPPPDFPPARLSPREALAAPYEVLPRVQAAGRICAQYLWAYPPGIPLAVPGEELTPPLLARLAALEEGGTQLRTSPAGPPGTVRAVKLPCSPPPEAGETAGNRGKRFGFQWTYMGGT